MEFANKKWLYDFSEIPTTLNEASCKKVADRLHARYTKIAKNWSTELNTEWLCRSYLSAKLIMQATLTVNSMEYAKSKNLRVAVPYLRYNSMLSLIRALILTLPQYDWKNGELLEIGHTRAIEQAADYISKFDRNVSEIFLDNALIMKASRELISYRAPSSGDNMLTDIESFLSLSSLIAELCQFNSELLEASITKHAERSAFSLKIDSLSKLSDIEVGDQVIGDPEDAYRLGYFARKHPGMTNIYSMMREGHVDDYFGAWCSETENLGDFDPDEEKNIMFDIP